MRTEKARVQLMQEAGVSGPSATIDTPEDGTDCPVANAARSWAAGQIGHPWDLVFVTPIDEDGGFVDDRAFDIELS